MTLFHFICSFPGQQFVRFGTLYIPPHKKQSMRKNNVAVPVDESKMCQLEVYYDPDVHDALAANWPKCTLSVACLSIFVPPKNRASTGPSPLRGIGVLFELF
jgi:hypothetical protein